MKEENIMKSILKDLKLESLIPKFAAERIEPENVSELSDDGLVRLGVTTIGDRHRLRALCANTEKKTSVYGCSILGDPGAVSRAGRKSATKGFKHRRKSPWVPSLTGPFPDGQANAGS